MVPIYTNLSTVYYSKKDYIESLKYSEKILIIRISKLGDDHPNIADIYYNMASTYYNQNSYQEALNYYKKALKIRQMSLGSEHINTQLTIDNIELCLKQLLS
jgi:tetratricopeptide (TPR) repeat protein